jgi:nucleoside-diphosphate-sugar epimerase
MKFTIFGSSGFIGSSLSRYLRGLGDLVFEPERGNRHIFDESLGHAIYCIGLTADFRQKPFETVRAHVCYFSEILEKARFDSLLYLSSTRVYANSIRTIEDQMLSVNPKDPDDLYGLSKLMGESLCFTSTRPDVRVVRLSNVFGNDYTSSTFVSSVISDAVDKKSVNLNLDLKSEKDYVSIDDVVKLLRDIAGGGRHRLYNLASGRNTSNEDLLKAIHEVTHCTVRVNEEAKHLSFPKISVQRIKEEFDYSPVHVIDSIPKLVSSYSTSQKPP